MSKKKNLIGNVFNDLTVISECGRTKEGHVRWLCECKCGNKVTTVGYALKRGHVKACEDVNHWRKWDKPE